MDYKKKYLKYKLKYLNLKNQLGAKLTLIKSRKITEWMQENIRDKFPSQNPHNITKQQYEELVSHFKRLPSAFNIPKEEMDEYLKEKGIKVEDTTYGMK